jgi:L-alanine-DL-glutamate epimerase-like enolase superfamily enzyme
VKISKLKTALVDVPLVKPIETAIHDIRSVGCVLVSLETDEGITGEGYAFTINAKRLKIFDDMILSFAELVEGQDPQDAEAIWEGIWNEINPIGHKGVTIIALSAIDTACWDIIGKAAGRPLYEIFGACRDRVKTYASGGLWLSLPLGELAAEAASFVEQGFRAMKVRVGGPNADQDVERVRIVRDAIGPEIELMADANQGLTPSQAIDLGRRLEEFGLVWFEEPVPCYDLAGHAEVRAALDVPIASGESEYTRYGMGAMIDAGACDILMPDLQSIGGLSEYRRAAALAAAHNIPISTHIFTEHSLSIGGSSANCMSVEHMPWFTSLFHEEMEMVDGMLLMPDRPGLGFTFDLTAVARFRLA